MPVGRRHSGEAHRHAETWRVPELLIVPVKLPGSISIPVANAEAATPAAKAETTKLPMFVALMVNASPMPALMSQPTASAFASADVVPPAVALDETMNLPAFTSVAAAPAWLPAPEKD